jgi:hypothetical protein
MEAASLSKNIHICETHGTISSKNKVWISSFLAKLLIVKYFLSQSDTM